MLDEDIGSFMDRPAADAPLTIHQRITEEVGTQIGPYKLIQELGEGGFGVVYLAEQQEPVRRQVALKIIKPGMDTREVITRFEAERQALALMDHPNIAHVLDAGATESGRPYFVMELVQGVPITDYCDQHEMTIRERLELFVTVCQAVQHAHHKGIIHRDLKPSNVLVAENEDVPVPKIIDFGVAKATGAHLTDRTTVTGLGQLVGTPMYMSPEQAGRNGQDVDTRSDIYSLGVLLYELLTGTPPFDKERFRQANYDEICAIIREQEPPKPSTRITTVGEAATTISAHRHASPAQLSRTLRGELDWIVMKALEKDRTRRYETANDFAQDIQRYLNDEPVEACPPSTIYRMRKFTRRNRVAVFTTTAISLALILGAGIAAGQAYRATQAERFANRQLEIANEQRRLARQQAWLAQEAARRERKLRTEAEQQRNLAEKATQEAEVARKQAEAVTNYLVEAFRSPDPERDGRTITVAEVLGKSAERLEKEFENDLPLKAQLHLALGNTYHALGVPREAVTQLEKAYEINGHALGRDDRSTLNAMTGLATAYRCAGRMRMLFSWPKKRAISCRTATAQKTG